MAVNWTNNFNDNQAIATVQFLVKGDSQTGATLTVDEFVETDPIDGSVNWKVGDEFEIVGLAKLYTITSITEDSGNSDWDIGVSPNLESSPANNAKCSKEGGASDDSEDAYAGNQGSAENHLRLRNMGLI